MTLAHLFEADPRPGVVVPFSRTSSAHWTAALLVLDARIAVAADSAQSLGIGSRRGREVRRCLHQLVSARSSLDALFAEIVTAERTTLELVEARAFVGATCDWCKSVAGMLRDLAEAEEHDFCDVRDCIATWSSEQVRGELLARMTECTAETVNHPAVSAAVQRLQGDVVVLNWNLRG